MVGGDVNTPPGYELEHGQHFGPATQESHDQELRDTIGRNCIQPRNIRVLLALDAGAEIVALVNDDNIPQAPWGKHIVSGDRGECWDYDVAEPAFDPIGSTNYPALWHPGFPLPLLTDRNYSRVRSRLVKVDIQADFWNGDPGAGAICRMEHAPECRFHTDSFPIAFTAPLPFRSQNTFFKGGSDEGLLSVSVHWPYRRHMGSLLCASSCVARGLWKSIRLSGEK